MQSEITLFNIYYSENPYSDFLPAVTFKLECLTKRGTYCALAPEDVSLLFSEEVLKSTPPRPILGAAAGTVDAVDVASREPNVNPPAPPRVVCPNPATAGTVTVITQAIFYKGHVPQTQGQSQRFRPTC